MYNFTPLQFPGSFCSLNSLIITSGRIFSPFHMCFKYVDLITICYHLKQRKEDNPLT